MLEHRVLLARRERLQCQLPFALEDAHVDATRRPLSPHQRGRLNDERRFVTACGSVESGQKVAAKSCRGWGASAWTARKPISATEREEREGFVAGDPSTYCSPRSVTSSNCEAPSLFRA